MSILNQTVIDNKYLTSAENDTWVDNIKDAFEMSYKECKEAKELLLNNNYLEEDIIEIVYVSKIGKQLTKEEIKELKNIIKNKTNN